MQITGQHPISELSVIVSVKLANTPIEMILNSGAGPSVLDFGTVRDLGLEKLVNCCSGTVYRIGQNPVHIVGNTTLDIDSLGDNQLARHSFGGLQNSSRIRILGRDLLSKFGSTEFDWGNERVRLGSVWKDTLAILEGGDALARSAVAALESEIRIDTSQHSSHAHGPVEELRLPQVSIYPNLPIKAKEQLFSMLEEFHDVFAVNSKSPTITPNVTHVIDTRRLPPVKHKERRVSPMTQALIDEQVDKMLRNGICRPSNSPWSSPIILVTKKDGGTRFVVDHRSLNDLTRKDAYPMPNPRDILDSVHGDKYYSSLDCASAYWAVVIETSDQPKTAFSTPRGYFEMTWMAFGLCIAKQATNG